MCTDNDTSTKQYYLLLLHMHMQCINIRIYLSSNHWAAAYSFTCQPVILNIHGTIPQCIRYNIILCQNDLNFTNFPLNILWFFWRFTTSSTYSSSDICCFRPAKLTRHKIIFYSYHVNKHNFVLIFSLQTYNFTLFIEMYAEHLVWNFRKIQNVWVDKFLLIWQGMTMTSYNLLMRWQEQKIVNCRRRTWPISRLHSTTSVINISTSHSTL